MSITSVGQQQSLSNSHAGLLPEAARQGVQVVGLGSKRPSLISEVVPALQQHSEHHMARRVALLQQLVTFLREFGDGEFGFLLGDALYHLPEVKAYHEHLLYIQSCGFEESVQGCPVSVLRIHGVLQSKMNAHQVQDYIDLVVSKGQCLGEHYVARQLDWAVVELELAGETHSYLVGEEVQG